MPQLEQEAKAERAIESEAFVELAAGALLHAARPEEFPRPEGPQHPPGETLLDVARACTVRAGGQVSGLAPECLVRMAGYSLSEFRQVVRVVAERSLAAGFRAEPRAWAPLASEAAAPSSFPPADQAELSGVPELDEVTPFGRLLHGTPDPTRRSPVHAIYELERPLPVETLVSGSLYSLTRIPRLFAQAAARKQADVAWSLLARGGSARDGRPYFSEEHGNVLEERLLSEASLRALARRLRVQRGRRGELLDMLPARLVVPVALEADALRVARALEPSQVPGMRPWEERLVVLSEPRLDEFAPGAWYLTDGCQASKALELSFAGGQREPRAEVLPSWRDDGLLLRLRFDYTAELGDWRGIARCSSPAST